MSKNQSKKSALALPVFLILAAAASRLLPHPYNFSPVAAMALFGGAVIGNKKLAFLIPLAALFLSDLCFSLFTDTLGFYGLSQIINYGAFALIVLLGILLIKKINGINVGIGAVAASVLFFLISNFGVWLSAAGLPPYTADLTGLVATYSLGIPFFGNTLLGDLLFSGVLFGLYELVTRGFLLRRHQMG